MKYAHKRATALTLALICSLLAAGQFSEAGAAVPTTLSFQGVLTDNSGVLLEGSYSLTFRLYSVACDAPPCSGSVLWTETHASVPVSRGGFSVILGETASLASLPFDVLYYLGISVGAGAEMTPRLKLTASPYALRARQVADGSITAAGIAGGEVVKSLNGLKDGVTLAAGTNVTLTPSGQTLRIDAAGGGGLVLPFSGTMSGAGDAFTVAKTTTAGRAALFSIANPGSTSPVLEASTNSTAGSAFGVLGKVTSTAPGTFSAGVRGENDGTGDFGIGVWGSQNGNGWGLYGTSVGGYGVYASSATGVGLYGTSASGKGVYGETNSSAANAIGVHGKITTTAPGGYSAGVRGENNSTTGSGIGVWGSQNGAGWGVYGTSPTGTGIYGSSTNGRGVYGETNSMSASAFGVHGRVTSAGPGAYSAGVRGENNGTGGSGVGVWGSQNGSGWGVYGTSVGGLGVYGVASNASGLGGYFENTAGGVALKAAGRAQVGVMEILGGADLAERFETTGALPAGTVMSMDPAYPGRLVASETSFDRRVAGVVSGAGGLAAGMVLGAGPGGAKEGCTLALTGRVYCLCDAGFGAIEPGDLLTSSPTPGHAMKVNAEDYVKAQGAILGKAMGRLAAGRGLVLVLVGLQ